MRLAGQVQVDRGERGLVDADRDARDRPVDDLRQLGDRQLARQQPYLRRLRRYALAPETRLVLEFGSGKGGLSLAIKRLRPELETCCLDFSGAAIRLSKRAFAHYDLAGHFIHEMETDIASRPLTGGHRRQGR